MFLRYLVPWPPVDIWVKCYGDRPRGAPLSRELNTRWVTEYSKIGAKLVLITNRKLHMSFRLVTNSVTLDDFERHNSPNGRLISPNSVAFGADYIKVVEETPTLSVTEI